MSEYQFDQERGSAALIFIAILAIILGATYYFLEIRSTEEVSEVIPVVPIANVVPTSGEPYAAMIASEAKATTTIDISGCKPDPAIAGFEMGSKVTFVNNDSVPHGISFNPKHMFVVSANETHVETFDYWEFPGVRKYNCDNTPNAGIVNATKK